MASSTASSSMATPRVKNGQMTDANCQSAWWKTYIEKQWQPEEPHEESSCIGEQHRGMRLGPVIELGPLIEETDEDMLDSSIVDKHESRGSEEDAVIQQFLENDPYNSQGAESGGTKWWCDSNDPEEEVVAQSGVARRK